MLPMKVSENNEEWIDCPNWLSWLIQFGYNCVWMSGTRKILLLSMPCESCAAALVALGAMIRELTSQDSEHILSYWDSIVRQTNQYYQHCNNCHDLCNPEKKGCGFVAHATNKIRDSRRNRQISTIQPNTNSEKIEILSRNIKTTIMRKTPYPISYFQIDGGAPYCALNDSGKINLEPYQVICPTAILNHANLSISSSAVCLSGTVMGKEDSMRKYGSLRFQISEKVYTLFELLTIKEWSDQCSISRMTFYNSRTQTIDRHAGMSKIVIADGIDSLLSVLANREFQNINVVGLIDRTANRDKLETIGEKISSLRQWYKEFEYCDVQPCEGINLCALQRG